MEKTRNSTSIDPDTDEGHASVSRWGCGRGRQGLGEEQRGWSTNIYSGLMICHALS